MTDLTDNAREPWQVVFEEWDRPAVMERRQLAHWMRFGCAGMGGYATMVACVYGCDYDAAMADDAATVAARVAEWADDTSEVMVDIRAQARRSRYPGLDPGPGDWLALADRWLATAEADNDHGQR